MTPHYHEYLDLLKYWKLALGGMPVPYTREYISAALEYHWLHMPEYEQEAARADEVTF